MKAWIQGVIEGVAEMFADQAIDCLDAEALRGALAKLETDRALAALMGRRGREVAHARYSAERMTDRYEALYRGEGGATAHVAR